MDILIFMVCLWTVVSFGGTPERSDGNIYKQDKMIITEGMKVQVDAKTGNVVIIKNKWKGITHENE